MRVARTVEDLIGSTPLVDLSSLTGGTARVLGKLEAANPGGSAKDRVARAMVDDAERAGRLSPGGTIIEPTSGNTGVGLAMIAAARGYRLILTMPDTMSVERRALAAPTARASSSRPASRAWPAPSRAPRSSPPQPPTRSSPGSSTTPRTRSPTTRPPAPRSGRTRTALLTCSWPAWARGARSAAPRATSRSARPRSVPSRWSPPSRRSSPAAPRARTPSRASAPTSCPATSTAPSWTRSCP